MVRWGAALAQPVTSAASFPGVQPSAVITPPYVTLLCLEELSQKKNNPAWTQKLLFIKNVHFVQIYHPTSVNPQNFRHVLISQAISLSQHLSQKGKLLQAFLSPSCSLKAEATTERYLQDVNVINRENENLIPGLIQAGFFEWMLTIGDTLEIFLKSKKLMVTEFSSNFPYNRHS